MADLIDPDKLVSLPEVAREYGFNPQYLSQLAAKKKITAWHVGNSWITTRDYIDEYVRNRRPKGRPSKKHKK